MSYKKTMTALFGEDGRFQRWLDVEIALAKAEGDLGLIPSEAAKAICDLKTIKNIPIHCYEEKRAATNHILVAFIRLCQDALGKEHGEFIHYGATTQDVCDTATMIALKELRNTMLKSHKKILCNLVELAKEHIDTLTVARTNSIQALPITFAFKVSGWISELKRNIERLERLDEMFVIQLGGAVGTLAAFGESGSEVQKKVAQELGLHVPEITWHCSRDRITEIASVFSICTNTLARMAQEVYRLMQTEISELSEPVKKGIAGSSTMPHKMNPHRSLRIIFNARAVRYRMAEIFEASIVDHERNISYCTDEMYAFEEIAVLTGEIMDEAEYIFAGLVVNKEKMNANLELLGGIILSEKLMFALGRHVGKQTAHSLVSQSAKTALSQNLSFVDILCSDETIQKYMTKQDIEKLLSPRNYIGKATEIVKEVINL